MLSIEQVQKTLSLSFPVPVIVYQRHRFTCFLPKDYAKLEIVTSN